MTLMIMTGAYTLYVLTSIYVSVMQIGYINVAKRKEAVLLLPGEFLKAGNYGVEKEKLSIVNSFVDYLFFIAWIGFGVSTLQSNLFFENAALGNVAIVMSFIVINFVASLPFGYYEKFALDAKFGFNKSSLSQWIQDTANYKMTRFQGD